MASQITGHSTICLFIQQIVQANNNDVGYYQFTKPISERSRLQMVHIGVLHP